MADILQVVDVHAPASDVFATVATVDGIRSWWSTNVEGGDQVGESVTIRFGDRWKVLMERTEMIPNQRVSYRITEHDTEEWLGTELVFDLSESDGWTTMKFDQRGWKEASDFFRFCSVKWVVFLLSIKQAVETGFTLEFFCDYNKLDDVASLEELNRQEIRTSYLEVKSLEAIAEVEGIHMTEEQTREAMTAYTLSTSNPVEDKEAFKSSLIIQETVNWLVAQNI